MWMKINLFRALLNHIRAQCIAASIEANSKKSTLQSCDLSDVVVVSLFTVLTISPLGGRGDLIFTE